MREASSEKSSGARWIHFHLASSLEKLSRHVEWIECGWHDGEASRFDARIRSGLDTLAATMALLWLRGPDARLRGRVAPESEVDLAERLQSLWTDCARKPAKSEWVVDLLAGHPDFVDPKKDENAPSPLSALLDRDGRQSPPSFRWRKPEGNEPVPEVRFTLDGVRADRPAVAALLRQLWNLEADPNAGIGPAKVGATASRPQVLRLFPLVEHVQFGGVYALSVAGSAGGDRVDYRQITDPREGHPLKLLPADWQGGQPVVRIDFQHVVGGQWYAVLGLGFDVDRIEWKTIDLTPYRRLVVKARAANAADDLHSALTREVPLRFRLEDDTSDGVHGLHQSTGWNRRPPGLSNRPREYVFDLSTGPEGDFDWNVAGRAATNTAAVERSRFPPDHVRPGCS